MNLPDFNAKLKALGYDLERRTVRAGVTAALQIFKRAVIAAAPVGRPSRHVSKRRPHISGTLKRSIYIKRSSRSSKPGLEYGILRPHAGQKAAQALQDAYYWRWVEAGHLIRHAGAGLRGGNRSKALQRKRLRAAGAPSVAGVWFIRDSYTAAEAPAIAAFSGRIEARIKKANRDK